MKALAHIQRFWWAPFIFSLLFFSLGLLFLPLTGLQGDEVYFAGAVYHLPIAPIFYVQVFHRQVPLMMLSYLGALKSWIYVVILGLFRPSYWTVRLPALLAGAASIWIFTRLAGKIHGRTVAWVAGILLATDTTYLLTSAYDWGPVALQHLLMLGAMALIYKFKTGGHRSALFAGFFVFGVAFWDKALFIWVFSGLVIAAAILYPRELWSRASPRNLGLAVAGLLVGALPLVIYNVETNLATFRSSSSFDVTQLPSRFVALRATWRGERLFDFIAHPPWAPGTLLEPDSNLFDISDEIHYLAGSRFHYFNALEPAFALALALLPFLWLTPARKPMLFCLIVITVAWLQMALTVKAGLGAHHIVLLWPFPHWFMALAFVQAAEWRRLAWKYAGAILLATLVVFLAGDNLLLTNEYYYQLAAYGPMGSWDDAIFSLSEKIRHVDAPEMAINDWGIVTPLVVLQSNSVPLYIVDRSFLAPGRGEADRNFFIKRLADDVWIGHTKPFEADKGVNDRIAGLAREAGFEKRLLEVVRDRNGRPVFEIFHFVPSRGALPAADKPNRS